MTMLTIIQTVCREVGLPVPSVVAASSDTQALQLMALLNADGEALCDDADWPALVNLATITTVNGTAEYNYPAGFLRIVDGTMWDRTNDWQIMGPDTVLIDRWRREDSIGDVGIRRYYYPTNAAVRIYPTPTVSGDVLVYNYVSSYWAETSGGSPLSAMTADTDVPRLDNRLLILGTIARWLDAKGLDSTNAMARYLARKESRKAAQLGGGIINMEPRPRDDFIELDNLPDSGYTLG